MRDSVYRHVRLIWNQSDEERPAYCVPGRIMAEISTVVMTLNVSCGLGLTHSNGRSGKSY
jgi:hypothetical protein